MRLTFIKYVLFLSVICSSFRAQEQYFIRHPAFTNLPSFECYNIWQCQRGYIWVGTAKGLFWYNADSVFAAKNPRGKAFESCFGVWQFNQSSLLILGNENYLYHYNYETRKCDSAIYSNALAKLAEKNSYAYNIRKGDRHDWVINTQYNTYKLNAINGAIDDIAITDTLDDFCFVIKNGSCYQVKKYFSRNRQFALMHGDSLRICIKRNGSILRFRYKIGKNNFPNWRSFCELTRNGDIVFSLSNVLIKVSKKGEISSYDLPDDVLCVYVDREDDLWVGTLKGGVHYFKHSDLAKAPMNSLRGISVTGVCFDYERNVWCSTLDKGVFISRSKENYYYPSIEDLNNSLYMQRQIGNCMYFSSTAGKIIRIKDKIAREYLLKNINSFVRDIIDYNNGFILIADKVYETDSLFNVLRVIEPDKEQISLPTNLFYYKKDSVYGISKDKLCLITKQNIKMIRKMDDVMYYHLINNQLHYFAGAGKSNFYRINRINELVPLLKRPLKVVRAAVAPDSSLWFFSADDSLFLLKNNLLVNISEKYNFLVPDLADIKVDNIGNIWLCGTGILMSIQLNKENIKIRRYKVIDGMKSLNVRRITTFGNEVLLNTDEGLFIIKRDYNVSVTRPVLYLHSIIVQGKAIKTIKNNLELDYNNNTVQLYFDALTFNEPGKAPCLIYRILEHDTNWRKTNTPLVELYNLATGKHTVQIKALNNRGLTSKETIQFVVNIAPPFWQTIWFIIIIGLLFAALIFYIIRIIITKVTKRERERAEIRSKLVSFQMSALQAQMNPHFLFNAINGIQKYILKKDKQEAYDYLAKFSKLIRMVLYNSQKSEVTLASELQIVKLYVEMERLRFENNFDFDLNCDGEVNADEILIPVMLLQPYIENAIWHGLMNLNGERRGKLAVDVKRKDNCLIVTITDNGVGREIAKQYKRDATHQSMAMSISENRLKLLNELSENSLADIQIVDLKDNEGNATGTMVIIKVGIHEE